MSGILSYGCGQIIPGVTVCAGTELPEEKPRLLLVDVSLEEYVDLAYRAVKRKLAVVLSGVTEENIRSLLGLGPMARRNNCALAVLGSWRYIPAIAAMKEIVGTGCLGKIGALKSNKVDGMLAQMRLADVAGWLGGELESDVLESGTELKLELECANGWIRMACSLDGKNAAFESSIHGHRRTRVIPKANPLVSELAILSMSLPSEGRIKKMPMMMTI